MPLYKLHEAPRVRPSFGRPETDDPNRMKIDEDAVNANANANSPSGAAHHAQQSPPLPSRVLSSSPMQQHQQQKSPHSSSRAVGIAPRPPQHELQEQSPDQQPSSSPGSPSIDPSRPPSLDNAYFGHSLYFIEHLFPSKLWRILDDAERCGYDNVISWVDAGLAFQIREFICLSIYQ